MPSRSVRLTFVAIAWIAIAAAGFLSFNSHKQILTRADAMRAVDHHAREASDALVDVRVAQQAYVASGQGVAFWMPKVAATIDAVNTALHALKQSTTTAAGGSAVDEAWSAMREFVEVDKRARDYIRSGQSLMAGDVIFAEGGQLATVAARQVETARQAEHQAFDAAEGDAWKRQATAIGGAAMLTALVALVLGLTGTKETTQEEASAAGASGLTRRSPHGEEGIVSHARPAPPVARVVASAHTPSAPAAPARNAIVLKAAADLATDFGRVRDSDELERLLARAADMMDADGLIVWLGSIAGGDLRPALAHGYGPQALARMPSVPRSADNAAASAYRTGTLQIVLSRPGGTAGAIVAPILNADGCIGSLSAEIKGGGEGSEAVQAVATIVAAHLAGVLAASPVEEPVTAASEAKAAQA